MPAAVAASTAHRIAATTTSSLFTKESICIGSTPVTPILRSSASTTRIRRYQPCAMASRIALTTASMPDRSRSKEVKPGAARLGTWRSAPIAHPMGYRSSSCRIRWRIATGTSWVQVTKASTELVSAGFSTISLSASTMPSSRLTNGTCADNGSVGTLVSARYSAHRDTAAVHGPRAAPGSVRSALLRISTLGAMDASRTARSSGLSASAKPPHPHPQPTVLDLLRRSAPR